MVCPSSGWTLPRLQHRAGKWARIHEVLFFLEVTFGNYGIFFMVPRRAVSRLRDVLIERYGDFALVGMHCPPMRAAGFREDEEVLAIIRDLKPHIVWVGLSTPKQELWLRMHMHRIGRSGHWGRRRLRLYFRDDAEGTPLDLVFRF